MLCRWCYSYQMCRARDWRSCSKRSGSVWRGIYLRGIYLRVIPEMCKRIKWTDRLSEDDSKWFDWYYQVGNEVHVHSKRNYKGAGDIWCERQREGVSCQKFCWGLVAIHSGKQTISSFPQIEGITWCRWGDVWGARSDRVLYRTGEVGDRASER